MNNKSVFLGKIFMNNIAGYGIVAYLTLKNNWYYFSNITVPYDSPIINMRPLHIW